MTNKDDIRLPEGYEDWVEVSVEPDGEFVKEEVIHWSARYGTGGRSGMPVQKVRYFVPPKPKPALPDVKPGAVVRFTHKAYGSTVQAIRWAASGSDWHVQFRGVAGVLCETYCGDTWLLNTVNADGFTVELDGL